ncbi:Hypothetical protein PBC10988_38000 [Planctomycetales bacterium 10988]|nr:Hypothetical protein PBC10988_38000 [Planctomycetales bacterium 10988]
MATKKWFQKKWLMTIFKLALFLLVVWGISARLTDQWDSISNLEQKTDKAWWDTLEPSWLLLAGVSYLLGLLPCAIFWKKILQEYGAKPSWLDTLTAYYIGHLGKYVPGKALVVVLRVGLLRGKVATSTATLSVFYETLSMMAIGAGLAGLLFVCLLTDQPTLWLLGLGLGLAAGIPVIPQVFYQVVKRMGVGKANPELLERLKSLPVRAMLGTASGIVLGWFLMGVSLYATIRGLGGENPPSLTTIPLLTAATSLSLVAGFLSLIPGGLGVREWVLMEALGTTFQDETLVLIAPLLLRIIWTLSEVAISIFLYGLAKGKSLFLESKLPTQASVNEANP